MNIEQLRKFCLSQPHANEDVKWGSDLCFCVGEKMFCVTGLEPAENNSISFKCTPEKFAELVEKDGIIPAPYGALSLGRGSKARRSCRKRTKRFNLKVIPNGFRKTSAKGS